MEDYPRTLEEFEGRFVTEQACREYLMQLRWPRGFACPRCGGQRARPSRRRGLLRCGQCDYQASLTAGTIFQDTRLPLRTWYRAMWWVTSQKTGASALGLQSILGLGSYRTAWALLHKLRRAMVRPGRDGSLAAQRSTRPRRRGSARTPDAEKGAGGHRRRGRRCRHEAHPDDGWEGYVGLEALGYRHEYDFVATSSQSASELASRSPRGCPVEALVDGDAPRRGKP